MAERIFAGKIALAGNPNVGKSTVFNALTHLHQHTGNWTGKTITCANGIVRWNGKTFCLVDLPGTYALHSHAAEEDSAREFLQSNTADCIIIVVDATCLERNLIFALQILSMTQRAVLCLNLMDEARKKSISIDVPALEKRLGIPVVPCTAATGKGLDHLMETVETLVENNSIKTTDQKNVTEFPPLSSFVHAAEQIAAETVTVDARIPDRDRRIDAILTSRRYGIPIMLALIALVFFLTITGANVPSEWLSYLLFACAQPLNDLITWLGAPEWLRAMLIDGGWNVLASVVSVMLPPMAIFFPLFTCLEDIGYLPRIAFNLDHVFCKARTCGKQVLTLCMGLGCNAAGVVGCRIIDSERDRMIAILTNTMVPCNGRFPAIISLITLFIVGTTQSNAKTFLLAAISLTCVVIVGVFMTLVASWLLSKTILKGMPSAFFLELPPYRRPQVGKIIVRSLRDRTMFVLLRAVCVAAPAGLLIWCIGNIQVGSDTLLTIFAGALDPFARWIGLDGMILLAFILGFPANEIVIPLVLMGYLSSGTLVEINQLSDLAALLAQNGWTSVTAVCFILFSLFHWPCSTTCLTIRKETGSTKWMLIGMILPTLFGVTLCFIVHSISVLL
ncbi:ferrous iron transporter B [Butyricicoccus pullicaecorum]|uniref:Ferrous iron transporter B n=1 Tax=Butyricicoccus pullicaecorum TaxID=501571 RepID=A0A1Y4LFV3_9FIRM|nr:ferrous iron transporter B [Butyricicoccus pullicaecorum]OUP53741.1 ferrous iron transporter B [Butyricicoccus pullicaecorum]